MESCSVTRIVAAAVLITVAGCGDKDWGYLSGAVKLNGEPVGPGTITFEPVDSTKVGAIATFGEDGQYTTRSSGQKEGIRTGEYRVLIQGGTLEEIVSEGGPPPKTKIPVKYSNPNKSDLKVTIEAGSQTQDFDLKP